MRDPSPDGGGDGTAPHRQLFERHPQPMWVYDLETLRVLAVNDAAILCCGYSRDRFLGMTVRDIPATRHIPAPQGDAATVSGSDADAGPWQCRLDDGRTVLVEIAPQTIDWDGRPARLVMARDITEQTRRAEQQRETELRFRQMAENIDQVFWMTDPAKATMLYVSPTYESVWGRPCESLYRNPRQWIEAVHEADRARVLAAAVRQETGRYDEEYRIVRPDGSIRWIADRAFPVRDDSGNIYRIVGIARDITDRKAAEQALRESEARFHSVARATADIIWDWDLINDTIWWSDDFEAAFGYPPAAFEPGLGAWTARVHPDDLRRVLDGIRVAIERRDEFWHDEYRFLHRDGSVLDIEDRGCLVLDDAGTPVRFVGGMRDITERKRAQRDLRERIKELGALYRVLALTTDDTRPVAAICDDIAALLPASLRHEDVAVARVVVDGSGHGGDGPVSGPSLRSPIESEGREIGFVEIGYREARADEPGGEGPFLGEERTLVDAIAMHIGRMIDDRRMADRLSQTERLQAIGELTGGIAHDFNNLLQVILGNADLLVDNLADNQRLKPLAATTLAAAARAAELTRLLLAFARRQPLDPRVTDVNRLIGGMEGLLRRTLGERVEIMIMRGDALWTAMVDAPQLENAVFSLCINGRAAMPNGGRLIIETANVHLDSDQIAPQDDIAPGAYVLIAISDNGTGMTPDVAARAFDPFFTTQDVGKGSGLGLSMVYGFAKQSNGHVKIYSEPGLGTTVRLYLPPAERPADSRTPRAADPAPAGGSEKILIVEDDALVREHAAAQLAGLGYRVMTARDGPEALEALARAGDFDLLFTDIVMPGGMNGRQLADAARRLRPDLPVLFTSGYAETAIVHNGRLDPGAQLLPKPYRRRELAAKIRAMLAGHSANRGPD